MENRVCVFGVTVAAAAHTVDSDTPSATFSGPGDGSANSGARSSSHSPRAEDAPALPTEVGLRALLQPGFGRVRRVLVRSPTLSAAARAGSMGTTKGVAPGVDDTSSSSSQERCTCCECGLLCDLPAGEPHTWPLAATRAATRVRPHTHARAGRTGLRHSDSAHAPVEDTGGAADTCGDNGAPDSATAADSAGSGACQCAAHAAGRPRWTQGPTGHLQAVVGVAGDSVWVVRGRAQGLTGSGGTTLAGGALPRPTSHRPHDEASGRHEGGAGGWVELCLERHVVRCSHCSLQGTAGKAASESTPRAPRDDAHDGDCGVCLVHRESAGATHDTAFVWLTDTTVAPLPGGPPTSATEAPSCSTHPRASDRSGAGAGVGEDTEEGAVGGAVAFEALVEYHLELVSDRVLAELQGRPCELPLGAAPGGDGHTGGWGGDAGGDGAAAGRTGPVDPQPPIQLRRFNVFSRRLTEEEHRAMAAGRGPGSGASDVRMPRFEYEFAWRDADAEAAASDASADDCHLSSGDAQSNGRETSPQHGSAAQAQAADYVRLSLRQCLSGGTGGQMWGAAVTLARWVVAHPSRFAGRRVLELGCGLGLPSFAAALFARSCVFSDIVSEVLAHAARSIREHCQRVAVELAHNQHRTPAAATASARSSDGNGDAAASRTGPSGLDARRCGLPPPLARVLASRAALLHPDSGPLRLDWRDFGSASASDAAASTLSDAQASALAAAPACDVVLFSDCIYAREVLPWFASTLRAIMRRHRRDHGLNAPYALRAHDSPDSPDSPASLADPTAPRGAVVGPCVAYGILPQARLGVAELGEVLTAHRLRWRRERVTQRWVSGPRAAAREQDLASYWWTIWLDADTGADASGTAAGEGADTSAAASRLLSMGP